MHALSNLQVLRWLEHVLRERFGHAWRLAYECDDLVNLQLLGVEGGVSLGPVQSDFFRANSYIPYMQWDAAAEGWHTVLPGALPAPGAACLPTPLIEATPEGYRIHYDILGLTYWMLNRVEEIGHTDLDQHGRFPATSSHAYQHGYLERPIVDEWLHILGQVIQCVWPGLELKQHLFSMKVSHDVDSPSRYGFRPPSKLLRAMGGDILKRGNFKGALLAPWIRLNTRDALHPADPYNTFDWLMDVSDCHGLRSAFYFICGHTDSHDADYQPEHPTIRHLMRHIHTRGHEIGLHASYGTYQKPDLIRAEADRLRRIAQEESIEQAEWGGRMHYLRWEQPITLRAWADAGMTYDSTLGYADHPGFRCGTCFEYPAFDHVAGDLLKLRIRPLIAMDCTVMASRYLGLGTGENALVKFKKLKKVCSTLHGCFTLLWHNTQLSTSAERRLYQQTVI